MLQGEKVNLRPVIKADLELLNKWTNDLEFSSEYNFFGLRNPEVMEKRFAEDGFLATNHGTLMVVTKEGEVVGDVSYHQERYGPNEGSNAFNIGIALHSKYRGRGYGVEAQKLLTEYLFATFPVMRIEASTDITNVPEQRSLEKAGFTRDGVMRKAQWRNGDYHDMVVYSKLRGE